MQKQQKKGSRNYNGCNLSLPKNNGYQINYKKKVLYSTYKANYDICQKTMLENPIKFPIQHDLLQNNKQNESVSYNTNRLVRQKENNKLQFSFQKENHNLSEHYPVKHNLSPMPKKGILRNKQIANTYNPNMSIRFEDLCIDSFNSQRKEQEQEQEEENIISNDQYYSMLNDIIHKYKVNNTHDKKFSSQDNSNHHHNNLNIKNFNQLLPIIESKSEISNRSLNCKPMTLDDDLNNPNTIIDKQINDNNISCNQKINEYSNSPNNNNNKNNNDNNNNSNDTMIKKTIYEENIILPNYTYFQYKENNEKASRRMLIEYIKILTSKNNSSIIKIMNDFHINDSILEQEKIKMNKKTPFPNLSFATNSQSTHNNSDEKSHLKFHSNASIINGKTYEDNFIISLNEHSKEKVEMINFLFVPRIMNVFNGSSNKFIPCIFVITPSSMIYSLGIEAYIIKFKAVNYCYNFEESINMLALQSCNDTQASSNIFTLHLTSYDDINKDEDIYSSVKYEVEAATNGLKNSYINAINYLLTLTQCKTYYNKGFFD